MRMLNSIPFGETRKVSEKHDVEFYFLFLLFDDSVCSPLKQSRVLGFKFKIYVIYVLT